MGGDKMMKSSLMANRRWGLGMEGIYSAHTHLLPEFAWTPFFQGSSEHLVSIFLLPWNKPSILKIHVAYYIYLLNCLSLPSD